MQSINPNGLIGADRPRIDGPVKVTGRARYGADQPVPRAAYGCLVLSTVARGRVRAIEASALAGLPILTILTHENVGDAVASGKMLTQGGYLANSIAPLGTDRIGFAGQIVAVVIAETYEAARAGAALLHVTYDAEPPTSSFDSEGAQTVPAAAMGDTHLSVGDAPAAFAAAAFRVDADYETPAQHHNPMELFQASCAWQGDRLTVYDSTQNLRGFQHGVAEQLGIDPSLVRVVSPFVGGAFGARGSLSHATALVALAARRLGRPVKLVASRRQGFTLHTYRAETRHRVRLAATADGTLTALLHDASEITARADHFAVAGSDGTARIYACPNVQTSVVNVTADRQTSGFMRAPPEVPYLFALESALDELAITLGIDPLDLRRRNDTMVETVTQRRFTSRSLVECIDAGAAAFGWAARDPRPGSMRAGDELVGFGYATALYPTIVGPAECRLTLQPDLRAIIEVGGHEIGTGLRTVVAQTTAELLGLPLEAIEVRVGDSDLPAAPLAGGSNSTASICTVVASACTALSRRLADAAIADPASKLHGANTDEIILSDGRLIVGVLSETLIEAVLRAGKGAPLFENAANTPHGVPAGIGTDMTRAGHAMLAGGTMKDRMQFAFGAQFVEVRVDRVTGHLRVPRVVGAYAAGRIMNPRTARSQLMGGQLWGVSSALHEVTELDHRTARHMNDNLGEYHIPVCADLPRIETLLVEEHDSLINPLGIKGVGELGIAGMNAAIANAVHHATGVRLRRLPIRIEDLLESRFLI